LVILQPADPGRDVDFTDGGDFRDSLVVVAVEVKRDFSIGSAGIGSGSPEESARLSKWLSNRH
jgi:hypothetical protein